MHWWLKEPMRLIQTNLREIDTNFDLDEYVDNLKAFSANVVLFNIGGIVANYDTDLDYHYPNPYLKKGLVESLSKRLKNEGIKLIGRFDFSKVNEAIATQNKDWLYLSPAGYNVNYNGQYHICINSRYQREYSKEILSEAIEKLDLDAVFFNMIGYKTDDYSGNYHGICQCKNCQDLFYERHGLSLPQKEDPEDSVFRTYDQFRSVTSKELFSDIRKSVKEISNEIAICTYTHFGTDIYRKESNTGFDRPLPEWNYSATENVRTVHGSWDDKAVSNSAVHFIDFPFRHSAVSPRLTELRIVQNLVNHGWLDFYVIGTLQNQDDRACFDSVKDLFSYHKKNIEYLRDGKSAADICVVLPQDSNIDGSFNEMRGMMRMLSESHYLYDLAHYSCLESENLAEKLSAYKMVILPDVRSIGPSGKILDKYVENGGKILITGASATLEGNSAAIDKMHLECAGVDKIRKVFDKTRGSYFKIQKNDKAKLSGFSDLDIIYLNSMYLDCDLNESAIGMLGHIPEVMFGPPEKCYYTEVTDSAGLILNQYGKGTSVFVPWSFGRQYEKLSNHSHLILFKSIIEDLLHLQKTIVTDCSELIEISLSQQTEKSRLILNLINHSGQLGTAFHSPVPITGIEITILIKQAVNSVFSLGSGEKLDFKKSDNDGISICLPKLELFEQIVINVEQ